MEPNTTAKKRKQKKAFIKDARNTSNDNVIDSSVKFTWSNPSGGLTGKVFRKKQKLGAEGERQPAKAKQSDPVNKKQTTQTINSPEQTQSKITPQIQSHFEQSYEYQTERSTSQGFIKRKHKKDKQLAKVFKDGDDNFQPDNKISTKAVPKSFSLFNQKPKDEMCDIRTGKSLSEKVFTESGNKFSNLPIHKHVVSNLEKIEFTTLTTVQEKAIPKILCGKDVLVRSQTGSGKTLAYAVPIIDALQGITPRLQRKDAVQAVIVVPTRELALQTHELFNKINTFQWIVAGHLCGGESRKSEKDRLRRGVHILIGTPGRLLDHVLHTTAFRMDNVRCLVLDEADRLLDMGFRKDIVRLVEELDKAKVNSQYNPMEMLKSSQNNKTDGNVDEDAVISEDEPPLKNVKSESRQTILLSATLTKGVSELADFAMKNHIFIDALDESIDTSSNSVQNSLVIPDTVKQEFVVTYPKHRLFTLSALILSKVKRNSKMFIFMASSQMVEYHYDLFTQCLVKMPVNRGKLKTENVLPDSDSDNSDSESEEVVLNTPFFKLHGSMGQKMRKEVFMAFRAAKSGVLICTDVAARGLDVPAADCIVQYTGPQTDEDYLHRVGRTGRAGQRGSAIIFLTHEEQEYISRLNEHRVFLKQLKPEEFLVSLCELMEEASDQEAAEALQHHYETSVINSKSLHFAACLAYSSWSRFYNSYPAKMRSIFDFKNVNLGHYAKSFALRDTPSHISRIVKGKVSHIETPRLNKKLANHKDEVSKATLQKHKEKRSISLITSEYASGLEPVKKKKKKSQKID